MLGLKLNHVSKRGHKRHLRELVWFGAMAVGIFVKEMQPNNLTGVKINALLTNVASHSQDDRNAIQYCGLEMVEQWTTRDLKSMSNQNNAWYTEFVFYIT